MLCQFKATANVQAFATAGHFLFRYAGTEADFCFVAFRRPLLLQILFVSGSALPCHIVLSVGYHRNHKYFPCSRIL